MKLEPKEDQITAQVTEVPSYPQPPLSVVDVWNAIQEGSFGILVFIGLALYVLNHKYAKSIEEFLTSNQTQNVLLKEVKDQMNLFSLFNGELDKHMRESMETQATILRESQVITERLRLQLVAMRERDGDPVEPEYRNPAPKKELS